MKRIGNATFAGIATLALGAGIGLGACGSDGDDKAAAKDADVTVGANDDLTLDKDEYSVKSTGGEVTIAYENGGSMTHTLVIEDVSTDDFKLRVTGEGDIDVGSAELGPGEYRIYCDVPGHEQMEATLTVS